MEFTEEAIKAGQVLLVDKPLGWSSFQAVNKIKWAIKKRYKLKKIKVGHAGTLDPLATGLLVICTGKFTKKIPDIQGQVKEYTGTIKLGATRPSYDMETEIDQHYPVDHITEEKLRIAAEKLTGVIAQHPPVFSAIKKDGKRLYELARQGKDVTTEAREVTIYDFDIDQSQFPEIAFRVVCSKGTYIRSLAHDLGNLLESGAYLSSLRRTKIGDFNVDNAESPDTYAGRIAES
ncbi:tRNA pseudouridine(55) synthase TruB [Robertkochia aurantiaca]|uniref:tRNA pseudouridine(55) synthase TruB n=1 Tax=Robertkochia aurantiaca TaxID=2873700 RepID=UPI001CCC0D9B|nr:tRNA pseudouridine(55) synthase TruB [Robertkochia sp. 3YJGBD-33]